ncbi:hypothetical protein ACOME3_004602 [Neoechinorhynchus agilis]
MAQLLCKFNVRSEDGDGRKLLELIKNPLTDHLPKETKYVLTSVQAPKIYSPEELADALLSEGRHIAIVVGAFARGSLLGLTDKYLDMCSQTEDKSPMVASISKYPLSAAITCTKLCSAFEKAFGIL